MEESRMMSRESHPAVTLIYFLLVIAITMMSMHPVFLILSFTFACASAVMTRGYAGLRFCIWVTGCALVLMTLINVLFNHRGDSVLFTVGSLVFTKESMLYGLSAALLLSSAVIWSTVLGTLLTGDKLVYIFGRVSPGLGLLLSMTFRAVPLLRKRYREIRTAQRSLAAGCASGSAGRVRAVSTLLAWSLETSLGTADSMAARGYGLRGRTSYHLFRFKASDGIKLAVTMVIAAALIAVIVLGYARMSFYPVTKVPMDRRITLSAAAFAIFLAGAPLLCLEIKADANH